MKQSPPSGVVGPEGTTGNPSLDKLLRRRSSRIDIWSPDYTEPKPWNSLGGAILDAFWKSLEGHGDRTGRFPIEGDNHVDGSTANQRLRQRPYVDQVLAVRASPRLGRVSSKRVQRRESIKSRFSNSVPYGRSSSTLELAANLRPTSERRLLQQPFNVTVATYHL